MIRVYAGDNFAMMGLNISIVMDADRRDNRRIMRIGESGGITWEPLGDPSMVIDPTFTLGHEEARALLDALLHHYEGAADMHTQRVDYMHERERVDSLLATVSRIAEARTNEDSHARH